MGTAHRMWSMGRVLKDVQQAHERKRKYGIGRNTYEAVEPLNSSRRSRHVPQLDLATDIPAFQGVSDHRRAFLRFYNPLILA